MCMRKHFQTKKKIKSHLELETAFFFKFQMYQRNKNKEIKALKEKSLPLFLLSMYVLFVCVFVCLSSLHIFQGLTLEADIV